MTGLRLIVVENDGEVIAAAWPGKIKTTSQMLAIILLLLNDFLFPDFRLGTILLYVCLFFLPCTRESITSFKIGPSLRIPLRLRNN